MSKRKIDPIKELVDTFYICVIMVALTAVLVLDKHHW